MMRFGWLLLCTAAASQCPAEKAEQTKGTKGIALVQRATNLAKQLSVQSPDKDHFHVVCHSQGCKEVQASLEVTQEGTKVAQGKLKECSTTRAALEQDLKKAAAARANVTAALEKCATERAELQAAVDECAQHRSETEQALAKCASERSALEAELHQCASIDRPAAEKALAECGVERAKLEKTLKELEEKLKAGGSSRRRSSRRRKLSLMETEDNVDLDEDSEASLQAQLIQVREQLSSEIRRENDLQARLQALLEKMAAAKQLLESNDADFDDLLERLDLNQEQATALIKKTSALAKRFKDAIDENGRLDLDLSDLNRRVRKAIAKEVAAAEDLLGSLSLQAEQSTSLLSMALSAKEAEEVELQSSHQATEASITSLEQELRKKEEDNEECDDVRATLVKAKATLASTVLRLKACLKAKEVLQVKIDAATAASKKAKAGLHKCLATKTKLKAALEECESKCKKTGALLEECLARKKVLAKKIKECHDARDLARKKLKECLDRKDELKQKIEELQEKLKAMGLIESNSQQDQSLTLSSAVHAVLGMLNEVSQAQRSAEAEASKSGVLEGGVEVIENAIGSAIVAAQTATEEEQQEMESALQAVSEMQELFDGVTSSLKAAQVSEEQAMVVAPGMGL